MSRWEPDAPERLERAALELFLERGFDQTTVPQIAERAGLTTRTFFRYFPDKREVLFAGEDEIPNRVATLMRLTPPMANPMELIASGFETMAPMFEGQLERLRQRRAVIAGNDGLRERELRKRANLSDSFAEGFRTRGVDPLNARLLAETTVTIFSISMQRWLDAPERGLVSTLRETMDALFAVTRVSTAGPAAL